jgi:hypothetical protein
LGCFLPYIIIYLTHLQLLLIKVCSWKVTWTHLFTFKHIHDATVIVKSRQKQGRLAAFLSVSLSLALSLSLFLSALEGHLEKLMIMKFETCFQNITLEVIMWSN